MGSLSSMACGSEAGESEAGERRVQRRCGRAAAAAQEGGSLRRVEEEGGTGSQPSQGGGRARLQHQGEELGHAPVGGQVLVVEVEQAGVAVGDEEAEVAVVAVLAVDAEGLLGTANAGSTWPVTGHLTPSPRDEQLELLELGRARRRRQQRDVARGQEARVGGRLARLAHLVCLDLPQRQEGGGVLLVALGALGLRVALAVDDRDDLGERLVGQREQGVGKRARRGQDAAWRQDDVAEGLGGDDLRLAAPESAEDLSRVGGRVDAEGRRVGGGIKDVSGK